MNIDKNELSNEQEYLKNTLNIIKELIGEEDFNIQRQVNSVNELKKYIWENVGTLDDVEILQEMNSINNNVSVTNSNIQALQKLKKSLENPYFGRIDFLLNEEINKIYVGINGVMKDFEFYVHDWRSPIASLFYNSNIGHASYEAPAGTIEGEVLLKRQYKIVNQKLERCFDSALNIDDDFLQEILAKSSSDKMTNIVSTIQQEQNEIIRNITDKYLIVQGIAGSGKTSVALHRIAYLLYKEKNLTSNNVLIFSPSDVFSSYISDVLPELGENNVLQSTFSDFALSYLKDFKSIESFTEFIERFYSKKSINKEEYNEIKYKLSNDFKEEIDKYLGDLKKNIYFTEGIQLNDKKISKEELTDLFVNKYEKLSLISRIEKLAEHICDIYNISYKKNYKKLQVNLLSLLSKKIDVKDIYVDMLKSEFHKEKSNYSYDESYKIDKKLNYDDLGPMLYMFFEINGYPYGNMIKHIIIDEAQDYSLLQFDMLKKIFKNSSFTILGDVNQTINPYYKYNSLDQINNIFEDKGKYIELNKTYRSSEEIIEYTNNILDLNNACSIRRNNNVPVVSRDVDEKNLINQLIEDIELMRKSGMKKISIITKNNEQAVRIYNKLKELIKDIIIIIIDSKSEQKINDVVILPSYISKGLEFDSVIAYVDKNELYNEDEKNLFYVVCTRAQHSLTVYNQKIMEKKHNAK